MNTNHDQHVHVASETEWIYSIPPANLRGAKMQLLTIGKVSVIGNWYGGHGQYFVAYAPLLKVNHQRFRHSTDY